MCYCKAPIISNIHILIAYINFTHLISLIFVATYKEARDIEIEAINVSTNDEEAFTKIIDKTHETSLKRQINKPVRFCTSSSSEDENNKNLGKH